MSESAVGVPLAFILAMAATNSNAETLKLRDTTKILAPGSLRGLLPPEKKPVVDGNAAANDESGGTANRLAQWFNFFNCYYGYWRRC